MHKKVLSIFAAAMVLSGLFVAGTIAPAAAQVPFSIQNFHPSDDGDADDFGFEAEVLSDRFDGAPSPTTAHLTAVATEDTERVLWYACADAANVGVTIDTQAELAACGTPIATDTTGVKPAGGATGAPVDEAYDAEWNIPVDLDGVIVELASLACIGTGERVELTGGLAANCKSDVEQDVALEDGQNFQGGTDAESQTGAGEMVTYCTSDVDGGPASATNDLCQIGGDNAGTDTQVAARFKAFPHGSPIPNNGFVFRVTADPTTDILTYAIFGTSDSGGIDDTDDPGLQFCNAMQLTAQTSTFECVVTAAYMATAGEDIRSQELLLQIFDFDDISGAGYCDTGDVGLDGAAGTFSHPDGSDSTTCVYDSHYVVSSERTATNTQFSWQPDANDGSPATNAGCDTGETPDTTEDETIGALASNFAIGVLCVRDQFNNPLAFANVTFETTGGDPGSEIFACQDGEATYGTGVAGGELHDEHGASTTNNSRNDDCHTTTNEDGEASVGVANYSTGTAIQAKPGTQTVTGCIDRQILFVADGGNQSNQPAGHGCADEPAGAKATGTVVWTALPDHVHASIAGTGGTNPCHAGQNVATRQIGQNVDILICTQILGPDPHIGATTNQPNGGRLKYTLVGSTGGQTELATNLLSQPTETDADGRATASLVCLRQGTDTLTITLLSDVDAVVSTAFPVQISCVTQGEPTATGSGSASPGTTTTAPGTTGPPTTPKTPRTVSLEVSRSPVSFGKPFALTGGVSSSVAACATGVTVTIRRTVVGQSSQDVVDTLTTNSDGTFSVNKVGDKSAQYIASVDDTGTCAGATSTPAPVLVKVKVILKVSDSTIRSGQTVTLKVAVTPCDANHAGTKVTFFKSSGGSFAKFASKTLSGDCKSSIKVRPGKDTAYQARYAKQDDDHLGGKSRKKAISVRG